MKRKFKIIFIYTDDFMRDDFFYSPIPKRRNWLIEHWSFLKYRKGNSALPIKRVYERDFGTRTYIIDKVDFDNNLKRVSSDVCFFVLYPYHSYDYLTYKIVKKIRNCGFLFANITEEATIGSVIGEGYRSNMFIFSQMCMRLFQLLLNLVGYKRKRLLDNYARFFGVWHIRSSANFVTAEACYYFLPNMAEKWFGNNILLHSGCWEIAKRGCDGMPDFGKYIVFVDQGVIDLTTVDSDKNAVQYITSPKDYLSRLLKLFDLVEKEYGIEVVIAAHPKSNYDGEEFGDRKVLKGVTPSLVKHAELVIIQFSTVLAHVVLEKKDFLNICCNDLLKQKSLKKYYKNISKELSVKTLNIDCDDDIYNFKHYIKRYSYNDYEKCKKKYLVSEGTQYHDMNTLDAVCSHIKKIVDKHYHVSI